MFNDLLPLCILPFTYDRPLSQLHKSLSIDAPRRWLKTIAETRTSIFYS